MLFYAFKMAVAIAFFCKNAVGAILAQNHRNRGNLNCFYSIFAKKRNSQSHFKYIKKHQIIPRNCCFGVITLCSPKKVLLFSVHLPLWYLACVISATKTLTKALRYILFVYYIRHRELNFSSLCIRLPSTPGLSGF